jgi:hypothetical protein
VSHLRKSREGFAATSSFLTAEVTTFAGAGERGDGVAPFVGGLVAEEEVEGEETTTVGRACGRRTEPLPLAPTVVQAGPGITMGGLRSVSIEIR